MEVHDLVLAKLAAGRQRDMEFAEEAIRNDIVKPRELLSRVRHLPVDSQHREHVKSLLTSIIAKASGHS